MSRFGSCFVAVLILGMCTMSVAEIPQMISYQGKVTDSGGTPVADGSYTMRFRTLYIKWCVANNINVLFINMNIPFFLKFFNRNRNQLISV